MRIDTPNFIKQPKKLVKIIVCAICLGALYSSVFKNLVYDWINLLDPFNYGFSYFY